MMKLKEASPIITCSAGLAIMIIGLFGYVGLFFKIDDMPALVLFAAGLILIIISVFLSNIEAKAIREELSYSEKVENIQTETVEISDCSDEPCELHVKEDSDKSVEGISDANKLFEKEDRP